jgi:hypothetical protein
MFSTRLPPAAGLAFAAAAIFLGSPHAAAQLPYDFPSGAPPIESGISIRAQVDLMFQPAFADSITVMQNSFETIGANASSDYIFQVLDQAAKAGLSQALAQGAKSGRVTVVATSCHIGVSDNTIQSWAPIGVFINTTDMSVGDDGKANFHTRIKFIPDVSMEQAPQAPFTLVPKF